MTAPQIWVIDDDVALRLILDDTLSEAGLDVKTFGQAKLAWQTLENLSDTEVIPQAIITDIRMPFMDGLSFSEKIHEHFPQIPVIIMTAHADVQSAVDSYQAGAFDYLPKPFELDEAVNMVHKAVRQYTDNSQVLAKANTKTDEIIDIKSSEPFTAQLIKNNETESSKGSQSRQQNPSGIIGQSIAMQQVFRAIGRLSHTPITVLITGESGTGKELIAHALHEHSPRKTKPFIALNMAAIPHELIESELFGHEKGAFTGASNARIGRFEQAHGGTLFLDEIGDMPLPTQTRLLRVLANGEFFRVGGQKPVKVDVRIIAATHQHLEDLVKQGKFREDLFYRLNVIRLSLPALRERREDIPLLVNFFMQTIAKSMQMPAKTVASTTMQVLQAFDWQGNVRQLENACRWLIVMASGQQVQIEDLPPEILNFYQQKFVSQNSEVISPITPQGLVKSIEMADNYPLLPNEPALQSLDGQDSAMSRGVIDTPLAKPISTNIDHEMTVTPTLSQPNSPQPVLDWVTPLQYWAKQALDKGEQDILQTAVPMFEKCLLEVALAHTHQHKGQAADLLGWGRNTLTRKFQQLLDKKPV